MLQNWGIFCFCRQIPFQRIKQSWKISCVRFLFLGWEVNPLFHIMPKTNKQGISIAQKPLWNRTRSWKSFLWPCLSKAFAAMATPQPLKHNTQPQHGPSMAKVSFTYACLGGNFPNYSAPWSINTFTDIHAASGRWDLGRAQLERNVGFSILSQQCFRRTFSSNKCACLGSFMQLEEHALFTYLEFAWTQRLRDLVKYLPKKLSFLSSNTNFYWLPSPSVWERLSRSMSSDPASNKVGRPDKLIRIQQRENTRAPN